MNIQIINGHLTRQSDLIPSEKLDVQINIIGAGAIGSFTALSLVKMGFTKIKVFDDDKINIENMNCQFYRMSDIGKYKVDALKELVKDFANIEIETINRKWNNDLLSGIVLCCVDSMDARKSIFEKFNKDLNVKLIIDSRMGAENALLYAIRPWNPNDIRGYEKTLYTDNEAVRERCTSKSTIYTSLSISGLIASTIKGFLIDKQLNINVLWDIKNSDMITTRINLT